jgi:hypothetical protein
MCDAGGLSVLEVKIDVTVSFRFRLIVGLLHNFTHDLEYIRNKLFLTGRTDLLGPLLKL